MASEELFYLCRVGDLENLRYLMETEDTELNVRDQWDSTPLYYACLCGHENLVEFLLERGATCEPSSFDGERCVYAALTDRIRALLKGYKAITPECMRRDTYRECLRRYLEEQNFADVCFLVHGEQLHAHRIILTSRSSYFAHMLETKWKGKSVIRLNHPMVKPWAFKAVLQYLYTGRLYVDVSGVEDCIILAKQCKLTKLKEILRERLNFIDTFASSKKGSQPIKVVSVEPESCSRELNEAFGALIEDIIPLPYKHQQILNGNYESYFPEGTEALLPFMCWSYQDDEMLPQQKPPYSDICFVVEDTRFYCHKLFMCGRSDYFKALLNDHFSEAIQPDMMDQNDSFDDSIPELTLRDVSAEDFAAVVAFIYQDTAHVKVENLFSVLCAADLYLLNGLKKFCANLIKDYIDADNAIPILKTARLFGLEGLEANCIMFLALNLEKFIDDTGFHQLIIDDASSIENREDKDSIPVVDEIRFHLMQNVLPNSKSPECNIYDGDIKLALLDDLLQSMDLEC